MKLGFKSSNDNEAFGAVASNVSQVDAAVLANLGYKQEMKREYNFLATFSFALSISGLMGTIAITYMYPLVAGGPAAAVWCWFAGMIGCLCIAWSVAEMISEFPTSGGMYYTVAQLVPPEKAALMCWIDGWMYIVGAVTGACSTDFGCAQLILAIASMNSNYEYVPTNGQTTGVAVAVVFSHAVLNSLPSRVLSSITKYYCIINIGTTIALIVHLLVKCPKINSASYTFTHVENSTGWNATGWAFCFGFLNVSWVMTSYDATARMTEESENAAKNTPLAIAAALTVTALLGWVLVIVFTLTMGTDIPALLDTGTGQPIAAVFVYAMGQQAATAYLSLAVVILWFCGAVASCSVSRTFWSFSRDRGLPYADFWLVINDWSGGPVRCVWLLFVINSCLVLINLGSLVAMEAIFSACAIATDWSYVIGIGLHFLNADKMGIKKGPFHLGKLSKPINAYACIWTVFVSIVFVFPTYMPVDKEDMNYTCVILGFAFIGAGGWWLIDARKWYHGPVNNVEDEDLNNPIVAAAVINAVKRPNDYGEDDDSSSSTNGENVRLRHKMENEKEPALEKGGISP